MSDQTARRSVRSIKTEIRRLRRRERLAATGHGIGVAIASRNALEWALGHDGAVTPMDAAVLADEGAKFAKRSSR